MKWLTRRNRPRLSIVVVTYAMAREAPRTLASLSPAYQQEVTAADYEVIVIDNGSPQRPGRQLIDDLEGDFRYFEHPAGDVSPAGAVNAAVRQAGGDFIAIIVDGARMATPGLVAASLRASELYEHPAVCGLSWHLGPDVQNKSMLDGYDQQREDELLDSIEWPKDGYRLFEIATLAQSSAMGFLGGMPSELSWVCLRRDSFERLGGFDERFRSPGGGLVNHEFRNRLMSSQGVTPMVLLGEGVFHQFHGGVATNVPIERHPMEKFKAEYEAIVGEPFKPAPVPPVVYFGTMPEAASKFVNIP